MAEFIVTPWEVRGEVDYDKLIEEFGTEKIDEALLNRIEKHTKEIHLLLRRKIFFSHRELNWILDEYEKGNKFFLYTGRGPSGDVHIGHLVPWIFTKWLQDKFDVPLYFQMTDDEKFLFKDMTIEECNRFSYENALDVIALGFDPKKTFIFSDIDYAKTLYREALKVAKRLTFSTAKAVFGFRESDNVGKIFFTSMQSVPAFLPSIKEKRNIPCLIPHAIDQDAHFRVSRDILPKMGFYKPAAIHSRFIPGLGKGGKMSASEPETCIFTTDSNKEIKKKVMNAFTGGLATAEEQRKLGGDTGVCTVFQYYYFLFEEDDKKIQERQRKCRSGEILCGECKKEFYEKVAEFITAHKEKREKARDKINEYLLKD